MVPPLTVGDRIYAIDEDFKGRPSVAMAVVMRAGEKQIRIAGLDGMTAGSGFDWRTVLSRERAERCGRTPEAAWEIYRKELYDCIAHHETEIIRLKRKLALIEDAR